MESTASDGCSDIPPLKKFRFEVVEEEGKEQKFKNLDYASWPSTNNRVVRPFTLSAGRFLYPTFMEDGLKLAITDGKTGNVQLIINGEAGMTMLEFWQKISSCNRSKTPSTFKITNDSAISCATSTSKARPHPKLALFMDYHATDDGCKAFSMKVEVPGCRPECKTDCSPLCGVKSIILSSEDLDKISRQLKYILEHTTHLHKQLECYNIMQDEIIRFMQGMFNSNMEEETARTDREIVCSLISKITTLDLKKPIITAFMEECVKQNVAYDINRYALYSFCMGQPEYLTWRWQEQQEREARKQEVEVLKVVKEEVEEVVPSVG
jgi:hypothetical protein